jgi:transmembrane sensor
MSASDEQIRQMITQRAADWFVANRAGMTPEQRRSFIDWLKISPIHVEEYLAIAALGRNLRQACSAAARSVEDLIEYARTEKEARTRWVSPLRNHGESLDRWQGRRYAGVAVSCVLLLTGAAALFYNHHRSPLVASPTEEVVTSHFQTGHGQQQSYTLADGSVVHLNTDSDITIRYSQTQRAVSLNRGEAVFAIRHQRARPFQVTARTVQVTDVGTRFDVRLQETATLITVIEGAVEVRPDAASKTKSSGLQVRAGQQVVIDGGGMMRTPTSVDAGRATAWLHRQISFEREPLEQVAAEFSRYALKSIEITTPTLRSLRISGVFTIDDTAAFVAFLRSLEEVQVQETATQIVVSPRGISKEVR